MIVTVGDLRRAIEDVPDDMEILLRVSDEDGGEQFMCCPSNAMPDAGCGEVEVFIIDGTDNECKHGKSHLECEECRKGGIHVQ
jgi:hypothetical protein